MATKRATPEADRQQAPAPMPYPDINELVKMQQRGFDACVEANRIFMQTAQEVARCQSEMMRDYIEHMAHAFTALTSTGERDDRVKAQTAIAQTLFEKTADHVREIAELIGKSNAEAIELMNGRMRAAMDEVPAAGERPRQEHAAE
jgi:phasin family protein